MIRILVGDCRLLMASEPADSVDAIVTDPPYGLGFMGKEWDRIGDTGRGARVRMERAAELTPSGVGHTSSAGPYLAAGIDSLRSAGRPYQAWCEEWATEALRVLKPGGYLLAFGGTRTYHRLACAVEDAGFEVRDCLMWLYGSGFPKSLNVSKAIDKAAGVEREVESTIPDRWAGKGQVRLRAAQAPRAEAHITRPATDAAREWDGWGTALKPAWEPIILARKPLSEPNVAANVLRWGTGALNVDGCRLSALSADEVARSGRSTNGAIYGEYDPVDWKRDAKEHPGRWPANVALDEDAAAALDEQSGELTSGANPTRRGSDKSRDIYAAFPGQTECEPARGAEVGGASRFFYTAKASRSERNPDERHAPGERNVHPTVKPVDLMRWLVRMVTPPGGLVCDPFMGSGSTGIAASREGFGFLGMEQDADYAEIARRRIVGDAPMFTEVEVA